MPFEITYKFAEDQNIYKCRVTHEQYRNFRNLPIIQECKIIKTDQQNILNYEAEMQNALNMAMKNDISHMRLLSQIV